MASSLKKVYQEVYLDLVSLLETIRKCKFMGPNRGQVTPYHEFPDYLFNGSLQNISEIHNNLFPKCIETCIRPIK